MPRTKETFRKNKLLTASEAPRVATRTGTALLPEGRGQPDQDFKNAGHGSKAARKMVVPETKLARKVIRKKARPGTVALKEIVKMQRRTDLLIPRLPF